MARTRFSDKRQSISTTRRSQMLIARLAAFALRLRSLAAFELNGPPSPPLAALYQQAREEISPALTPEDCADLLAQVQIYCALLISSTAQQQQQSYADAARAFLKLPSLPSFISRLLTTLGESSNELSRCVYEIRAFLAEIDLSAHLEQISSPCTSNIKLIYFYEKFLEVYAPDQRSQRGVYYTPAPAITYIVKALDKLLREVFAYPGGLAEALQEERPDQGAWLCDPACGTGAFLWEILDYARSRSSEDTPSTHMGSCLYGYELMPAAYALACIERALYLPAHKSNDTVHLSLLNALEHGLPLAFPSALPIILGNPPYAGHSLNHSPWLGQLLETYKAGDASLKRPAQTKWLSDDYVQFLRLAQWQVEQAGRGIVAFLTSHSYLDNPTFRAMRLSLLRTFDEIYIVNLHGNSKRREQTPWGERDANIFTIQQGVAIGIFVKRANPQQLPKVQVQIEDHLSHAAARLCDTERLATVHYVDVWGERALYTPTEDGNQRLSGGKLGWLAKHDLASTPWRASHPGSPFYLFTPRDEHHQAEYMANWSLPAIFALNGTPAPGLVTCHDQFAISWNADEARAKIATFLATSEEAQARRLFRLCSQHQWDYTTARRELQKNTWPQALGRILYRPFDIRWTVFEHHVAVHQRERVTRHMRAGPNLALAVGRAGQAIDGGAHWDIAFCSLLPTEFNLYRRGGNYLFPLYLYSSPGTARIANLAPPFVEALSQRSGLHWLPEGAGDLYTTFGPDDVFAYIYALLYAPSYRARYAHFLKIDFPRIPLPTSADLFRALCAIGYTLSQLHLLARPSSNVLAWKNASAQNLVVQPRYRADKQDGCVYINDHLYLEGVPAAAWELTIGGHQVAKKWLWDRRGCQLIPDDLALYCQIISSLTHTCELMQRIDHTIQSYHIWPF